MPSVRCPLSPPPGTNESKHARKGAGGVFPVVEGVPGGSETETETNNFYVALKNGLCNLLVPRIHLEHM